MVPENKLRFALTARFVKPDHIDADEIKKGEFSLAADQVYDGKWWFWPRRKFDRAMIDLFILFERLIAVSSCERFYGLCGLWRSMLSHLWLAFLVECPDGLYCLRVAGILDISDDLSPGVLWYRYIPYCCTVLLDCFCFDMVQDVYNIFSLPDCYLYHTLWSTIYISLHKVSISID